LVGNVFNQIEILNVFLQRIRMTKKRKHQEDFQKVKLKVGKKKPKLENATDTTFKTKAIQIPEQLKEDGMLTTQNRKLNIKVRGG